MAKTSTLHDALIDELRDLYNAEKQITRALPRMAKAATAAPLVDAFESHLQETMHHIERLEQVFESFGETARGRRCEGMAGILDEGKEIMDEDFDEATMDACLVGAAQRVEHYEIASSYGTAIAWAHAIGHEEAARLLEETLEEEKATDAKLTSLAEGGLNDQAAAGAHDEEEKEEEKEEMKKRRRKRKKRWSRKSRLHHAGGPSR